MEAKEAFTALSDVQMRASYDRKQQVRRCLHSLHIQLPQIIAIHKENTSH